MYHITKLFILISLIILCFFEELDNSDKSWSRHLLKIQKNQNDAEEETTLKACVEGNKLGLVEPILIGNENKIKEIAKNSNLDISKFQIINE